jgi:predicted NBD/HSP70 family sugar kinase
MHAVLAQGAALPTQDQIAEAAGVNRRTISNVIRDLRPDRLIAGRRPVELGPGAGLALGISLGFETLRGALIDANGVMHHQTEDLPTPRQLEATPGALLNRLRSLAARVLTAGVADQSLWAQDDAPVLRMLGVAVAWPCPVDRDKHPGGTTLRDEHWRRRDPTTGRFPTLPERLAAVLGPPFDVRYCHALNDASANALAVAFDDSRGRAIQRGDDRWRVSLVVRVGGGIGASTILLAPHSRSRLSFIDARVIEGANGFAGELGHLPIDRVVVDELNATPAPDGLAPLDYDNWVCSCSRRHHLEVFASGTTLERRLKASGYAIPTEGSPRDTMLRAAFAGDADDVQIHAIRDIGRVLGRGLAGPILMLDPSSITITGSLANEHLVEGIRRERDAWANAINDSVEIRCYGGTVGAFAGARGAALAIVRRSVYRAFLDEKRVPFPTGFGFGERELECLTGERVTAIPSG